MIPGTGHLVVEERPDDFNETVRRFAIEAYARPAADAAGGTGAAAAGTGTTS